MNCTAFQYIQYEAQNTYIYIQIHVTRNGNPIYAYLSFVPGTLVGVIRNPVAC